MCHEARIHLLDYVFYIEIVETHSPQFCSQQSFMG
jgi:hypothetical protein